jgi:predicted Rossmann fold nucleotide-binding protein DprA/Smf involved in DNA uptake
MSEHQQAVFDAVDDTPTTFETILIRTDLSIATVAEACDNLVEQGVLSTGAGWWSRARS